MAEAEQVREELRAAPDSLAIVKVLRAHGLGNLDVLAIGAEELARRAAPVGGAGVRLTEEEMKALLDPRGDWDQALGSAKKKLLAHLAASVGEGNEGG